MERDVIDRMGPRIWESRVWQSPSDGAGWSAIRLNCLGHFPVSAFFIDN
jgi:hypothetical protein